MAFTRLRKEVFAGITSFFAISYIIIVNPMILADAGIPQELSVFATIFISFIGCLLMGLFADAPIILTPGMGINAFFTYTVVTNLGFSWQGALGIAFLSALAFLLVTLTRAGKVLAAAVPLSLKCAITCGIGLFLVEIGLEKAKLIKAGTNSILALGDLSSPAALLSLLGLVLCLFFHQRKVTGGFFLAILLTSLVSYLTGALPPSHLDIELSRLPEYPSIVGQLDYSHVFSIPFFIAFFSMTMILVFESIGLLEGLLPKEGRFPRAFRASAATAALSALLGTSPTVAAAESAAGILEGGRRGVTAVTAGVLFLASLFFVPLLTYVPESAVAPVIIITGAMMMQQLERINFADFSEWFPAFLIVVLIPLTNSISTGLAFGFAAYPMMKAFTGKARSVSAINYGLGLLFLLQLILSAIE